MADETEKGGFGQFLGRADGGLLALNLASLMFVAGLAKIDGLQNVLNLRLLAGGLSIALFFAILCAYFTLFGVRATAGAASRIGLPLRFEEELPVAIDIDHPNQWMMGFLTQLLAFLTPTIVLICILNLKKTVHLNSPSIFTNIVIIATIAAYLFAPFLLWVRGGHHFGFAEPPPHAEERRLNFATKSEGEAEKRLRHIDRLMKQIRAIQLLRLVAAFVSLAAFMLAAGLALVNVGVANVPKGLTDTPAALPAPTTAASEARRSQPQGKQIDTAGEGELKRPKKLMVQVSRRPRL